MAAAKRDAKGRLLPGETANPNGRPAGRQTIEAVVRRILDERLPMHDQVRHDLGIEEPDATRREAVARQFVHMLQSGHPVALRAYLDRDWPATQKIMVEDEARKAPEPVEEPDHVELVREALAASGVLH